MNRMRSIVISFLSLGVLAMLVPFSVFASTPASLVVASSSVRQGDPIMVSVVGSQGTSTIKKMTFDGEPLFINIYKSKLTAFIGVDLHKKPGTYTIRATFTDGGIITKKIIVNERQVQSAPLGIPAQLGGNTPAAQTNLVTSLTSENKILASMMSTSTSLWTAPFVFPVANPIITDTYGGLREVGQYLIPHKGIDFKAAVGTPVMTINSGRVIFAGVLGIYGNTVAVDHGGGIISFYMHLSKISVKKGQRVLVGQKIGLSGETGYAEGPHLHLTLRINGISIDPTQFFKLFH